MKISIGKQTDVGCVREANEDSFYVELPSEEALRGRSPQGGPEAGNRYALLIVADGMGGQVAGKEASETAVEVVKTLFAAKAKTGKPLKDIKKFLVDALREANKAVFKKGEAKAVNMGTTLTMAFIADHNAFIGHVGDSRTYHIRKREIRQVTDDHSLAEDMVKKGKATREEVKTSPMRSMLTRSIGTKKEVAVDDPIGIELEDGDCLVLCTDGLTNLVEDQEILSAVHNTADLQKACNKLVDMARKRGGHDNITIVAAEFGALERIKGLGIKAKTVVMKSKRGTKNRKRMILFAAIGLLAAIFILLAYLLVSHYIGQDRFYKTPSTEQGTE
ncbi:MAG: Stp1/IreP family PP2C-type Ser/Thr phosphatase [Deltaproteobacteria bacterium]|nr:Stp1/IreP family PP2C-type Ser/Thr phosphatase [Deltaproteobacteria bacterium]